MTENKKSEHQIEVEGEEQKDTTMGGQVNPHMKWYVVHTHSGLENRAKKSLEERILQYEMQDKFGEILVPTETVEQIKNNVKKIQSRKCFPGYMLVQMELNDETSHLVRNTAKVSGFVGGSKMPSSLQPKEVEKMLLLVRGVNKAKVNIEYFAGDTVRVTEGPFANFQGTIEEVKPDKKKLRVTVSIFGRSTPVELDFSQVEKIA